MEPHVSTTQVEGERKERKKIQFAAMEPHESSQVEGERKERKKIQFAAMEPHESSQVEGECKERKKIQFADMDLNESTQDEGEQKERKKIQFAVQSSAPPNLDPRQVEMGNLGSWRGDQRIHTGSRRNRSDLIRRRRPTPATLFRVADQGSPEDDQSTHQWVVGENGVLKPKRVNPHVYQPPSLRAVQKMAEAQMQKLGVYPPLEDPYEGEEYEDHWQSEEREDTTPTKAADHQETAASDASEKVSCMPETARQIEAGDDEGVEEEDEEETKKTKEDEKRRGNN